MKQMRDPGIVDMPILIVLCIFLSVLAIGIGNKALHQFDSLKNKQNTINCFNKFIEESIRTCYGEPNSKIKINLDLSGRKIIVDSNLVQLKEGNEIIKSEYLPLPVALAEIENKEIRSGIFLLELTEKENSPEKDLFLKITRVLN